MLLEARCMIDDWSGDVAVAATVAPLPISAATVHLTLLLLRGAAALRACRHRGIRPDVCVRGRDNATACTCRAGHYNLR